MINNSSNNSNSIIFLKNLYKQKYLFLIILALFALSSVFLTYLNKKKNVLAITEVTIIHPEMQMLATIDSLYARLFFFDQPKKEDMQNYSYKKFIFDFSSALASHNNLINYLNKQTNDDYLKILNEQSIDPETYFNQQNFRIIENPKDLTKNFSFILLMKHPWKFNAKEFLKDYVNTYKEKTISKFINRTEDNILNSLTSSSFFHKDASYFYIQKMQQTKCILEVTECLENLKKITEYLDRKDQIVDMFKNNLVKEVKQLSNNFLYEPILEIKTEEIRKNSNSLIVNLFVSLLLSIIFFFTIVLIKDFFKDLLKKS